MEKNMTNFMKQGEPKIVQPVVPQRESYNWR